MRVRKKQGDTSQGESERDESTRVRERRDKQRQKETLGEKGRDKEFQKETRLEETWRDWERDCETQGRERETLRDLEREGETRIGESGEVGIDKKRQKAIERDEIRRYNETERETGRDKEELRKRKTVIKQHSIQT